MNLSWGRRAAIFINAVAIAAFLAFTAGASAGVVPEISTSLSDNRLGAHADLTVDMNFGYGATGTLRHSHANPWLAVVEDPFTYPAGQDFRETVRSIVTDIAPGMVGNPNAVPFEERCDMEVFRTSVCPDSATVGRLRLSSTIMGLEDDEAPVEPNAFYISVVVGDVLQHGGITKVSLLKTAPEVPAVIGVYVVPPLGVGMPIRTILEIAPDTNSDLRLRTTTPEGIDTLLLEPGPEPGDPVLPLTWSRVNWMQLTFFGTLANGRSFMTNPTNCAKWESTIWASATFDNSAADETPLGAGKGSFKRGNTDAIIPDCTNYRSLPFPITGKVAISSPNRNTSPAFDFTIENPGVQADGQVSTSPQKIVTTIPAAINVDVAQLGRLCSDVDFNADTCAASTKVGTVRIESPLILDGLTGDVYLVKQAGSGGLPDLGLRVRGAISFTQRGTNRYTGATYNQIETTFDEIPQVGFSKLTFHLFGGPNGLLRSLSCPTYNKAPALPNFTYNFTAWSGATSSSVTPLNMKNCFGIQELKPFKKCLHTTLSVRPNYQSRSRLDNVRLYIDGKLKATSTRTPFRFSRTLKRLKLKKTKGNKHKLMLRAEYDDGTVSKKLQTFRTCR